MKFEMKSLGLIDKATLELADLTIICGENNTGKTYVTYALYGFLRSWRPILALEIRERIIDSLKQSPLSHIDLASMFRGQIQNYVDRIAKRYSKGLPRVFAASPELLSEAGFTVSMPEPIDFLGREYEQSIKDATGRKTVATLRKAKGSADLEVLRADQSFERNTRGLTEFISDAIADLVFAPYFPNVFIASAERTGAAIFRKELDFARTRLVEALGRKDVSDLKDPFRLLEQMEAGYAWPVQDNVDFVRQLEDIDRQVGPLAVARPDLMAALSGVIGGTYKVIKGKGLYYQPKGSGKPRLSMSESSSSVRALLDVSFYLRCSAEVGDLLMIDEPELNLHPVNQRSLTRLIAQLVNSGVKVFMTTHSDYIVKELNTLIMLDVRNEHTKSVQRRFGYRDEELISPDRIKLYMTCCEPEKREGKGKRARVHGLRQGKIHMGQGIEVETFDRTINTMNEIQSEILFGEEL